MTPSTSLSPTAKARVDSILAKAVDPNGQGSSVPPTFVKILSADGPLYEKGQGTIKDGSTIDGNVVLRSFSSTKLVTSVSENAKRDGNGTERGRMEKIGVQKGIEGVGGGRKVVGGERRSGAS